MKTFIVFALFVAAAIAAPAPAPPSGSEKDAVIISSEVDNLGIGPFSYKIETSNGISAQEQGVLKNAGTENEASEVRGQFSYIGTDGIVYTVTYIANENGFQPSAAHLPVAPTA